MEIQTDRLRLVLETREEVLTRIEAMSPAQRAHVSPVWLARVRASGVTDPWTHGFRVVERASGAVVGSCGFKGPPDAHGVVEIAYGVAPDVEGRGFATEVARALVTYAFAGGVRRVCAHTVPDNAASARVLAKCGFVQTGRVEDPEDGPVLRWELAERPLRARPPN